MADGFSFELTGMKEFYEAMKELPQKTKDSVLKAYNRKLAKKYIVEGMKSALPYSPRQKDYIIITSIKGDKTGVSAGFSTKAKWIRYMDKGTEERYTKAGAYRGRMVPRNRVGPYIEQQVPRIIEEFQKDFGTEILKTIDKKMKSAQKKLTKLG